MPVSKNTKYALGISAGLVGSFLLYHHVRRFLAQRRLDRLRQAAVNGEIPTRMFLEAALAEGEPAFTGGPRVTIPEAKRLSCEQVFPNHPAQIIGNVDFGAVFAELRRNGTCL